MSARVIKALGEIALRVSDLDAMQAFYGSVVGLELMDRSPGAAFFKIAEGYGGHTQILALFDRKGHPGYSGLSAAQTTIDHFAFTIALGDFESEVQRLEALGVRISLSQHAWVHWRSLYMHDPEGNEVELVCYDESV
jgi:catechol 2,3-dioxygenase